MSKLTTYALWRCRNSKRYFVWNLITCLVVFAIGMDLFFTGTTGTSGAVLIALSIVLIFDTIVLETLYEVIIERDSTKIAKLIKRLRGFRDSSLRNRMD